MHRRANKIPEPDRACPLQLMNSAEDVGRPPLQIYAGSMGLTEQSSNGFRRHQAHLIA